MPEAYIYDHVRTPRGKGKADGSLHEVTALALATTPLKALKERNNIQPGSIDDVVQATTSSSEMVTTHTTMQYGQRAPMRYRLWNDQPVHERGTE